MSVAVFERIALWIALFIMHTMLIIDLIESIQDVYDLYGCGILNVVVNCQRSQGVNFLYILRCL